MVGEVEANLESLGAPRQPSTATTTQPSGLAESGAGPPPLPFDSSTAIRDYLSNPRNAAVLASYLMETIPEYSAANYPREFANLVLAPQYKKSVFWTPVAPR